MGLTAKTAGLTLFIFNHKHSWSLSGISSAGFKEKSHWNAFKTSLLLLLRTLYGRLLTPSRSNLSSRVHLSRSERNESSTAGSASIKSPSVSMLRPSRARGSILSVSSEENESTSKPGTPDKALVISFDKPGGESPARHTDRNQSITTKHFDSWLVNYTFTINTAFSQLHMKKHVRLAWENQEMQDLCGSWGH